MSSSVWTPDHAEFPGLVEDPYYWDHDSGAYVKVVKQAGYEEHKHEYEKGEGVKWVAKLFLPNGETRYVAEGRNREKVRTEALEWIKNRCRQPGCFQDAVENHDECRDCRVFGGSGIRRYKQKGWV